MSEKPILHWHHSEFPINFSKTEMFLKCHPDRLIQRFDPRTWLKCTWFPSLMECSHGKPCENVVFGSKHGGLLRNSHRICKYLIHLWTHCSLQREILSLKLCFKLCVYTEPYAVSEQIVTSNVWKLKQHMEGVLEVLMLPNVSTLFLCSGMLIGPTQMLWHTASWIFPLF